jgi:hypothetical protein
MHRAQQFLAHTVISISQEKVTLVLGVNVSHALDTYTLKKTFEIAFGAKKVCTSSAGEVLSAVQHVAKI